MTPALECVHVWNYKLGTRVFVWSVPNLSVDNGYSRKPAEVTLIIRHPIDGQFFAVGYSDGSVRLWKIDNRTPIVTFHGHTGAISAMAFDTTGTRLATGSKDNDLVIWDTVAEQGVARSVILSLCTFFPNENNILMTSIVFFLCRLRGHKDSVTGIVFLHEGRYLVSISKDHMMKIWNITLQHCIETTIQHQTEIWSIAISNDERYIYTGAADNQLRVWTLDEAGMNAHFENEQTDVTANGHGQIFKYQGSIRRQSHERTLSLKLINFEDSCLLFCTVGGDFCMSI